jgi:hypothetical protein
MKVDCTAKAKKFIMFVMTGKFSPSLIHNEEFERFSGVKLISVVFSMFNTG